MTLLELLKSPPTPGTIPVAPFIAEFQGAQVVVTAVLERTAVYERERDGERALAKLKEFEPVGDLRWVPDPNVDAARARRGRAYSRRNRILRAGAPS